MPATDTINHNLFCRACAYNLRGLSLSGACPECGEPIQKSLISATSDLDRLIKEDPRNVARRQSFEEIAQKIGCSADSLMFVVDAVRKATRWRKPGNYDAQHVCMAVRIHAINYFNSEAEAKEMLAEWGLRTGDDIGKIIYGLVEHGFMQKTEGDSVEQFSGQFDLERLFPSD